MTLKITVRQLETAAWREWVSRV